MVFSVHAEEVLEVLVLVGATAIANIDKVKAAWVRGGLTNDTGNSLWRMDAWTPRVKRQQGGRPWAQG